MLPVCDAEVIIDSLPGLFGDLEPHRSSGLLLADSHSLNGVSVRGNVFDFESDNIATAQLTDPSNNTGGRRTASFSGGAPVTGLMAPPAKPGDRKVVIVIFVVEREIRVELRHWRAAFAISV